MSTPDTEINHTPDWRLEIKLPTLTDGTPYVEIKGGVGYAGTPAPGFQFTAFMRLADAQLITAAPELLEALEMLMPLEPHSDHCDAYDRGMWQNAREAIAKAKNLPLPQALGRRPSKTVPVPQGLQNRTVEEAGSTQTAEVAS